LRVTRFLFRDVSPVSWLSSVSDAGSSAMARGSARGPGLCPIRTTAGTLRRRRKAPCSRGTARAAERMPDEVAGKARQRARFRRCSSGAFYSQTRAGRGLALRRCPPSLCARSPSQRRRGGDLSAGGGRISGPALPNITRCWIVLEVPGSAGSPGAGTGPKTQGARMRTPKPRRRCIPPEGRRDFTGKAGTGEPVGMT